MIKKKDVTWIDGYPFIKGVPATEDQFNKLVKPEPVKKIKVQKSEAEIARQYAKVIMDKQRTRGMISEKFSEIKSKTTINKDLWQDTDFFFSVVFQSADQKSDFLFFLEEKFKINFDYSGQNKIQIINGLKLAEQVGCVLKKEVASEYPLGNIELKSFILDEERK